MCFLQFSHEALAETHHFSVCFPFGSKSDPPLPPPIGRPVKTFLKICSNPRNFKIPWLTVGWKRSPPLWDLQSWIEHGNHGLLDVSFTVNPRNTERNYAFRFCNTSQDVFFDVFRMFFKNRFQVLRNSSTAWRNSASWPLRAFTVSKVLWIYSLQLSC